MTGAKFRMIRDDIDKFFDYGLEIQTRTLYMGSIVNVMELDGYEPGTDFQMAEYVLKGLHILDWKGKGEITIIMNNLGGDEYHGLAIYDAIRCCENWVRIKAFGYNMSMGSWIFQAADERLMAPNATMMIHHGTWGMNDVNENAIRHMKEGQRLNRVMEDVYLEKIRVKHPKFTRKMLIEKLQFDTYMDARKTVDLGLADGILEYETHGT